VVFSQAPNSVSLALILQSYSYSAAKYSLYPNHFQFMLQSFPQYSEYLETLFFISLWWIFD